MIKLVSRGLRQGDPLHPVLFILVMEVLNSLIKFAIQQQLLQPLVVQHVTHRSSFYADDARVFRRPNSNDLQVMKFLLEFFGYAPVVHTKLSKSSLLQFTAPRRTCSPPLGNPAKKFSYLSSTKLQIICQGGRLAS